MTDGRKDVAVRAYLVTMSELSWMSERHVAKRESVVVNSSGDVGNRVTSLWMICIS